MQYNYLKSFSLASEDDEVSYILSFPAKLEMTCYGTSAYPFKIFPQKGLHTLEFEPVTLIYGSNGSGKSTLLNIIAQKLGVLRCAPFNYTPLYEDYLRYCRYTLAYGRSVPPESRVITSDDVFDFLLDLRAINSGIEGRRQTVFEEYDEYTDPNKP
ncbi:MAG TPA: AAA family ATPase, partial [Bacillota bacterium]|nr:AAA family ATPase [Bacillota bacterium]